MPNTKTQGVPLLLLNLIILQPYCTMTKQVRVVYFKGVRDDSYIVPLPSLIEFQDIAYQ